MVQKRKRKQFLRGNRAFTLTKPRIYFCNNFFSCCLYSKSKKKISNSNVNFACFIRVKAGALKAIKRNRNPQEVSSDSDHEKAEKSPTAKTIESGKKRKVQIGKKVPVRPINGMDRSKGPLAELSEGGRKLTFLINI